MIPMFFLFRAFYLVSHDPMGCTSLWMKYTLPGGFQESRDQNRVVREGVTSYHNDSRHQIYAENGVRPV